MKHIVLAISLAALLLCIAGEWKRKDYRRSYEEHTRELVVHWEAGTALVLRGTLLTAPHRDAMARERERLLEPTDDDHARFLARMADDAGAYHEVVFSADTGLDDSDLRFGDPDGWQVRLSADGTFEELVTIYRVRRPSPLHKTLYLHHNIWSELWIARFRRTVDQPSQVTLHVGSGWGAGELAWDRLREGA